MKTPSAAQPTTTSISRQKPDKSPDLSRKVHLAHQVDVLDKAFGALIQAVGEELPGSPRHHEQGVRNLRGSLRCNARWTRNENAAGQQRLDQDPEVAQVCLLGARFEVLAPACTGSRATDRPSRPVTSLLGGDEKLADFADRPRRRGARRHSARPPSRLGGIGDRARQAHFRVLPDHSGRRQ